MNDIESCHASIKQNINWDFIDIETDADYPKGCYLFAGDEVLFNKHASGSRHIDAGQICTFKGR